MLDVCCQYLSNICRLEEHLRNICQLNWYIDPGPNCQGAQLSTFGPRTVGPWIIGPRTVGPNCPEISLFFKNGLFPKIPIFRNFLHLIRFFSEGVPDQSLLRKIIFFFLKFNFICWWNFYLPLSGDWVIGLEEKTWERDDFLWVWLSVSVYYMLICSAASASASSTSASAASIISHQSSVIINQH